MSVKRARAALEEAMPEYAWQALVIDIARLGGFRVAHFRAARVADGWRTPVGADGKGWPDLLCAKPGRLVAIECKRQRGRLTPEQIVWLDVLAAAGAEAYIWRPSDEPEVWRVLTGRARP